MLRFWNIPPVFSSFAHFCFVKVISMGYFHVIAAKNICVKHKYKSMKITDTAKKTKIILCHNHIRIIDMKYYILGRHLCTR